MTAGQERMGDGKTGQDRRSVLSFLRRGLARTIGFGHPRHCGLGDEETTLNASHPKAIARPRPLSQRCVTVESMCLA
jgi:hypothetical protein